MRAVVALAPLWLTAIVFLVVLRSGTPAPLFRTARPHEPHERDRCTWYCHNHGCDHGTRLPRTLSDDLFYATVGWLHRFGDRLAPASSFVGYQAANLIVFCAAWPGGMYVLYLVALRQRRRLRGRR